MNRGRGKRNRFSVFPCPGRCRRPGHLPVSGQKYCGAKRAFASFMPKPFPDKSGNGLHINMSLSQNGRNIFKTNEAGHSKEAESFLQGIMDRFQKSPLSQSLTNSYARFGSLRLPDI